MHDQFKEHLKHVNELWKGLIHKTITRWQKFQAAAQYIFKNTDFKMAAVYTRQKLIPQISLDFKVMLNFPVWYFSLDGYLGLVEYGHNVSIKKKWNDTLDFD